MCPVLTKYNTDFVKQLFKPLINFKAPQKTNWIVFLYDIAPIIKSDHQLRTKEVSMSAEFFNGCKILLPH